MNCKAVKNTIIDWLRAQLEKSGQHGFVLGVSGGVDSALVSTLCAATGKSTLLLTLPIYQAEDQMKRGADHIKMLMNARPSTVTTEEVNLNDVFDTFKKSLSSAVANDALVMANLRARLRMTTIYAYAGRNGYLVAGTGNKIEDFGVGFFTKWGDGAVDLSPIGDLSKSQVWELAHFVGVSDDIVKAVPTDGLWSDNRGDENQIGATYPELEWAMGIFESHKDIMPEELITRTYLTSHEREVLRIYITRHNQNMHKFNPIPICIVPSVLL